MSDTGPHIVLFYEYVEDIMERRGPHRDAHLEGLRAFARDGLVVMAGALGRPAHGAAIVFRGEDEDPVRRYMDQDPYVSAGLVRAWRVEPFNVVA